MAPSASVLFAYDGSEPAKHAIREAAGQLSPGRRDDLEIEAAKMAGEGARLASSVGFDATPRTENGAPIWQTIVSCAGRLGAGIVVMGSHGRTGIGLVLIGSVAEAVSRHADQPVLIVH